MTVKRWRVDLNRPGFSVEKLGLTDFTVAGVSGQVSDINIVTGRARDIAVSAGDFALPAGYSSPPLMQARMSPIHTAR